MTGRGWLVAHLLTLVKGKREREKDCDLPIGVMRSDGERDGEVGGSNRHSFVLRTMIRVSIRVFLQRGNRKESLLTQTGEEEVMRPSEELRRSEFNKESSPSMLLPDSSSQGDHGSSLSLARVAASAGSRISTSRHLKQRVEWRCQGV